MLCLPACRSGGEEEVAGQAKAGDPGRVTARRQMVEETIVARGVRDSLVLRAMLTVPRHRFVPARHLRRAYGDHPLPIGAGQTISQPYIVALMSELLELTPGQRVLEVGTGSGYQAAVLAELTDQVYTIEIVESLAASAARLLGELGYAQVQTRVGDGYRGWPEAAPFDAIIVTAAPDHIPPPLIEQLRPGGRLVIPVGDDLLELVQITRQADGSTRTERVIPVRFVPMTGEAEQH